MLRLNQTGNHSKKIRVIINKFIDSILGELFNYIFKVLFRLLLQ